MKCPSPRREEEEEEGRGREQAGRGGEGGDAKVDGIRKTGGEEEEEG